MSRRGSINEPPSSSSSASASSEHEHRLSQLELLSVLNPWTAEWVDINVALNNFKQTLAFEFPNSHFVISLLGATINVHRDVSESSLEVIPKGLNDLRFNINFPNSHLMAMWKSVIEQASEYSGKISCAGYLCWCWEGSTEWIKSYAVVDKTMLHIFPDATMENSLVSVALVGVKVTLPEDFLGANHFSITPTGGGKSLLFLLQDAAESDEWLSAIYGVVADKPIPVSPPASPKQRHGTVKFDAPPLDMPESILAKRVRSLRVQNLVTGNQIQMVDMSGFLCKLGKRGITWKKRFFTLHANGSLTYSGPDKFGIMEVLGDIQLYDTVVKPLPPEEFDGRLNVFGIFSPDSSKRTYYLQAGTKPDTDRWIIALNSYREIYVPTSEECVFEGYLRKLGHVIPLWKEQYVRLYVTKARLDYFKNERERRVLGTISLDKKCRLQTEVDQDDACNIWSVSVPDSRRKYYFSCGSKAERKNWIKEIQNLWSQAPSLHPASSPRGLGDDHPRLSVIDAKDNQTGWLMKLGEKVKNWKRRWFVLSARAKKLKYYERVSDKKEKGEIPILRGVEIKELDESDAPEFSFAVTPCGLRRTYFLQAETLEDRKAWIEAIQRIAAGARGSFRESEFRGSEFGTSEYRPSNIQ